MKFTMMFCALVLYLGFCVVHWILRTGVGGGCAEWRSSQHAAACRRCVWALLWAGHIGCKASLQKSRAGSQPTPGRGHVSVRGRHCFRGALRSVIATPICRACPACRHPLPFSSSSSSPSRPRSASPSGLLSTCVSAHSARSELALPCRGENASID